MVGLRNYIKPSKAQPQTLSFNILGHIFIGRSIISRRDVAIKIEPCDTDNALLEYEYHLYSTIAGGVGIPKVYWFGAECGFNIMVMELLGPSLLDLWVHAGGKLPLRTVLCMAEQLVCAHSAYKHRLAHTAHRLRGWSIFMIAAIFTVT